MADEDGCAGDVVDCEGDVDVEGADDCGGGSGAMAISLGEPVWDGGGPDGDVDVVAAGGVVP